MDRLAVRPVAKRVLIRPIRLVINQTPPVLAAHVAKAMIEVRKSIRILTVSIWHRLLGFLPTAIKIGIEEPMPRKDSNHEAHCHRSYPPVIVGWRIGKPRMKHLLVEEI